MSLASLKIGQNKPFLPGQNNNNQSHQQHHHDAQQAQQLIRRQQQASILQNYLPQRKDIHGLKTIAIFLIIVFHAWPEFIPGGFVGIDVFFVISGYLVTEMLIEQNIRKTFTYTGFFNHQVKNVYPALLVVFIAVLVIACWKVMKDQLQIISKTMLASTIFGANIELLTQKENFDPDIKINPLSHLWAISIEQQFYLVWSIIISAIVNINAKKGLLLVAGFILISLFLNFSMISQNSQFAFYSPLTRFWELAIGGLIAYQSAMIKNKNILNALSIVGISVILISVFFIEACSLYPGIWTFVAAVSASLIILAGEDSLVNKHILSSSFLSYFGKISYSMYLWHWPLLVFSKTYYSSDSDSILADPKIIICIAMLLSILTYYNIELPIKFSKNSRITLILIALIMTVAITALNVYKSPEKFSIQEKLLKQFERQISLTPRQQFMPRPQDFYVQNGKKIPNVSKNPKRYPATKKKIQLSIRQQINQFNGSNYIFEQVKPSSKYYRRQRPQMDRFEILNDGGSKSIFMIGDSHGQMLAQRYRQIYEQYVGQNKQKSQFPTIVSMLKYSSPYLPCNPIYDWTYNYIKDNRPSKVIIINNWSHYFKYTNDSDEYHKDYHLKKDCVHGLNTTLNFSLKDVKADVKSIKTRVSQIMSLGIQVYFVTLMFEGDSISPQSMVFEESLVQSHTKPFRYSSWKNLNKNTLNAIETAVKSSGGKIIDFSKNVCWEDSCQVITPYGFPIMKNSTDFTLFFSKYWLTQADVLLE